MRPFGKESKMSVEILYEDNHLLILNKQAGLLTEPSGTAMDSLLDQGKNYLKEKYQKQGNVYLGIVHRLDKPASGIVLFAKTSKALSRLNAYMREKKFKKTYMALVEKQPAKDDMILENYLVHDDYKAIISHKNNPDAKFCRLQFKVVKKTKNSFLLEVLLETGRYHQIRAQLGHIQCPILGDQKYGSTTILPEKNVIALHHSKLEFIHPVTGEFLVITSKLPYYFN